MVKLLDSLEVRLAESLEDLERRGLSVVLPLSELLPPFLWLSQESKQSSLTMLPLSRMKITLSVWWRDTLTERKRR